MLTRTNVILLAAMAAIVGVLTGCIRRDSAGGGSGGGAPPADNMLRYAITSEPTTFDPALVQDGPTIDLLFQIYEGLVQWTESSELAPNLAERWEISADGKIYTFHIKRGAKFHNGREVIAEDFVYAINRSLDPAVNSQVAFSYLNDIVGADAKFKGQSKELPGVKALDSRTLQITLVGPRAYFLAKLTYPTAYAIAREEVEKGGGRIDERNAVGTGPFKLKEYSSGLRITLEAFADYHGGKPKLAGIVRPIQKDANQRYNMFLNGDLDIVDVQKSDLESIKKDVGLAKLLQFFDRSATYYLGLNQSDEAGFPPFKDVRVRQAFACALDKDAIIQRALRGVNQRADGIVPPHVPGHNPNVRAVQFDVARAKELLKQAGYPDGNGMPRLTLTFREKTPDISNVAQVVQQMLKQNLGVEVDLREMEWGAFLDQGNKFLLPFTHLRWSADYLDAQNFLSTMLHSRAQENHLAYRNSRFDALCDQADGMTDAAARLKLYNQAEQIIVDEAPWIPIYYQKDIELIRPYVKGIRDIPLGHLPHVTTEFVRSP